MGEETQLIHRCLRGDSQAWDELFALHYDAAARFVFQFSSDITREDAEEVCQEVFLAVVRNLGSFNAKSRLQTWIFRIAANKARDFLDKRQTAKRGGGQAPVSLDEPHPETGLAPDVPSGAPGPDEVLVNEENARLIVQALAALGDPCREIIELRYFGGLSYEEIAATLRLNPKTVSSRLSKCLDRLAVAGRRFLRKHSAPAAVQSKEPGDGG